MTRYNIDSWRSRAACRDIDAELFFPVGLTGEAVEMAERAKTICRHCPVRDACLAFALGTNQQFGIWGGRDEEERRELRRQGRLAAVRAGRDGE